MTIPRNFIYPAPDAHEKRVRDAPGTRRVGNVKAARIFAMMAGIDAALLKIGTHESPFNRRGMMELHHEWLWGHRTATAANDNREPGVLL